MKLKLLNSEFTTIIGDQTSPNGSITSVKIIKKNNFVILETFGVFLETDLIVSGFTASYGTFTDKVNLQWQSVPGVTYYRLFRDKNKFITEQTGTTYTDTVQPPGVLSTYAVKTAVLNEGITYVSKSVFADGWIKLSPTSLVATPDALNNRVNLEWLSVSGATAYKVFKTEGQNTADLRLLGITTSTSLTDRKVGFKRTYTYGVKASCVLGDSDFSNIQTVVVTGDLPDAPTNVTASTGEHYDKVVIQWTAAPFTQFYNVYRDTESNKIGTDITGTSFEDRFPVAETQHQYYVSSENINGESAVKTSSNLGWKRISIPSNVNASDGTFNNKVKVSWDTVAGATGYHVYKGAPLAFLQTVSGISFDDTSPVYGQTFIYAVKSIGTLTQSELSSADQGFVGQSVPEFAPTGVSASDGNYWDKIEITWNPVSTIQGVSGYKVYRNASITGITTNTSFTDDPNPGLVFDYTVSAFNLAGEGIKSSGNTGWVGLTAPSDLIASKKESVTQIVLNWNSSNGATAYKIFRGTPSTLSFLNQTENTTFTDSGLVLGQTFAYAVKASCSLGDSGFSRVDIGEAGSNIPLPSAPTGVSASDGNYWDKVEVTWNSVAGISGYVVYADGVQVGTPAAETFNHVPPPGAVFNYTVAAKNVTGVGPESAGNTGWRGLTAPDVLTASTTFKDRINLGWSSVEGATAYKIFTGTSFKPEVNVQLLGVTTNTQFTDFTPTFGLNYRYSVKSSCPLGDSDYSATATGFVIQSQPEFAPTGVSASDGAYTSRVEVTWNPVSTIQGVSGYRVYRITPSGSSTIQNTTSTTFNDTGATPGLTFEYKVLAFNRAGDGPLSPTGNTGWMGLTAPVSLVASDGSRLDKVELSWASIHGPHVSYRIFRGSPPTEIETTSSTLFDDTTISPGTTAQYSIKAFTSPEIQSDFSNTDIGFMGITAPAGLTASLGAFTDKVAVRWNDVQGAPGYRVYRNNTSTLIGTVSGVTLFEDTTTTPGVSTGYFVSSFIPDVLYESVKTGPVSGWRKLSAPTGLTASKAEFTDRVRVSWNSVAGATAYKVFRGVSFSPETGVVLLGLTTTTQFFDLAPNQNALHYTAKASCPLGDSDYGNTDTGYINNIYSDIIQYTNEIQARYKENIAYPYNAVYAPAPPRLPKWTGPLYWNPINAKTFVEGVTAIAGKMYQGFTQGVDIYHNYIQFVFNIGMRLGSEFNNALGSTASYPELKVRKYDPNSFWVDLNGTLGITLRGGTANEYIRHRTLNDIATKPPARFSPDTNTWANPRNKLFWSMGEISDGGYVYDDLADICSTWRLMLPVSAGATAARAAEPTVYKSHLNARIQTQDYLNLIKTMLTEIKNQYPLAIPRNGVNNKAAEGRALTRPWTDAAAGQRQYVGMSGGYRIISPPIGATSDFDPTTGQTVNTWSPDGPTADQGEYLVDAWRRRGLVKSLYMLEGITTTVNPEGISGGQLLSQDPSWNTLFQDLRALLTKELRDHVKHFWERRAWYMVVNDYPGGRDSEFGTDMDNLGWIQGNQWLDPLASVIQIAMYLYPFATTELEKQALLAAYNMCSESLAGMIERALDACTDCDSAGIWTEGFGYAAQSFPPILNALTDMKRMGDRRLWDAVTKRGQGVSYSCWANNAWKWMFSRVMPNCAIINSGSCDSSDYSGGTGNGYQIYGWPHEHIALLASEYPPPGEKGSALSTVYGRNKKMSGLVYYQGATNLFYELKKYHENGLIKPYRDYSNGHYFPDDQTFTWTSDFIIPDTQDERFIRAIDQTNYNQIALTSKPFIFGLWGKGSCKFDGKAHRDEGHVSAYMGDAMILLELGEIRADESDARKWLEKESPGHNRMQLGGFRKFNWPRPATITGVIMGKTGGSLFMDTTSSYNTRSLTFANEPLYPWMTPPEAWFTKKMPNGQYIPWGYGPVKDPATNQDIRLEYQYQISKVTRGISWAYEPYNRVSSYIRIADYMGLSGICAGVSGPTERVYYRFHAGHTGATSGTDNIFILGAVPATNNRVWTAGWTAPLGINVVAGGYTCDYVGVTMTFSADQPINIVKTLVSHRANKEAHLAGQRANFADQLKNYALDISLGLSGAAVHDQMKLNLVTEINSMVFRNNAPIIIPTEKPVINNYRLYQLTSTSSLLVNSGCPTAPTYRFPSWSVGISKYPGISFGRIMIDDFLTLPARSGFTLPNALWTC